MVATRRTPCSRPNGSASAGCLARPDPIDTPAAFCGQRMTTTLSEGPRTLRRVLTQLAAANRAAEQSALLKNSLALISGTVFSQAILFLFSPLLSRIFSRTDFGHLANYNAWVSILALDRKSTRLNSSHGYISYAVFCLKKKKKQKAQ